MNINKIYTDLHNTFKKDKYKGIDQYDIKGLNLFLQLQKFKIGNYISIILTENFNFLFQYFVKPNYNSKALALFILGSEDKQEITKLGNILIKKSNNKYSGKSYGYPFKWNTGKQILDKNEPSLVVSSFVGMALIKAYKVTKLKKYISYAEEISFFIITSLNKHMDNRGICFSYTPKDHKRVINANYLGARFLLDLSKYTNKNKIIAEKMFKFCNSCQNKDGSWNYDDPKIKKDSIIDNYHTAFNLISLQGLKQYNKNYKKGLKFYKNNLFQHNWPLFSMKNKLPIDIHSFAAAIILFANEDKSFALNLLKNCYNNMYNKKNKYFYYRIYKLNKIKNKTKNKHYKIYNQIHLFRKDKTKFMRWSQAWMFWAIERLKYLEK